jgi:hypothetical protein
MKYLFLFLSFLSCSQLKAPQKKAGVVFFSGEHIADSSWNEVIRYMPRDTRNFEVVEYRNLPSFETTVSLEELSRHTCPALQPGKSIVVAHSFAGALVGSMLRVCPEKVKAIIYLSALIPIEGEKVFQQLSEKDQKQYEKAVDFKKNLIKPKDSQVFYKTFDSSLESTSGLPRPGNFPLRLSNEIYRGDRRALETIPKYYIETMNDQIYEPKTQEAFIGTVNLEKVWQIKTGHLPMYSEPMKLSDTIVKALNAIDHQEF